TAERLAGDHGAAVVAVRAEVAPERVHGARADAHAAERLAGDERLVERGLPELLELPPRDERPHVDRVERGGAARPSLALPADPESARGAVAEPRLGGEERGARGGIERPRGDERR